MRLRTLRPTATVLFVTVMAVIAVIGWVAYRDIGALVETSSWVTHTEEVIGGSDSFLYRLSAAEAAQSRYVLTGSREFLDTYRDQIRELEGNYSSLVSLVTDDPVQSDRLEALRPLLTERLRSLENVIQQRDLHSPPESINEAIRRGRYQTEDIRNRVAEIKAAEQTLLSSRIENQQRSAFASRRAILLGGSFAFLCLLLAGVALNRDISRRMRVERVLEITSSLQRAILNSSNYAILSTDSEGIVVTFNAAAESMFGYSAPEMVGKLTPVVLHEAGDLAKHAALVSKQLKRTIEPGFQSLTARARMGVVDESEWTYFRRDGSRFPGLLSVSTMHDEDGYITGFVFIISDISLRKEAARARLLTERRYRALLQNSSDIVAVLDPLGRLQYVSPAVTRLLGYTVEELIGRDVFSYVNPEEVEMARQSFYNTAMRPGYAPPLEVRLRNAAGEWGQVEIIANNLLHDEVLHGIVINARDISERKRARSHFELQNAVARVLAQAETLEESISQVLHTLSSMLQWEMGEYWAVDVQDESLRYGGQWSVPGIGVENFEAMGRLLRLRRGESFAGKAWAEGTALHTATLYDDETFSRGPEAQALSLHSAIAFPVQTQGKTIGVVVLYSRAVQGPDPEQLAVFEAVGKQLGQFIARKLAEEEIKQNEERYRYLFDSSSDIICTVAPDYSVLHVNTACLRALGYTRDELRTMNLFDLVPVEEHERWREMMKKAIADGMLEKVETSLLSRAGRKILVEGSVNCRIAEGQVLYCSAIFDDVTKRREVENMKNEFVSIVSHELRTPLTSIRGSLGLLAAGLLRKDPEKGERMLEIALKNTERLVRLINDILDIEKIESGKTSLDLQPTDAPDLLQQAAAAMNSMAEANGVKLEIKAQPGILIGDRDRLLQTLTNLLSNAIKFSPPGSQVWLSSVALGGELLIQVRDVGRGIPADKLESIFERFQQVDASDSRNKGGTGLGLAICRSIVHQHGGRVWAESQEGKGSVFSVRLPRFQALRPSDSAPTTILVCDDDPVVVQMVSGILSQNGYQVLTASSGQQAFDQAMHHLPDAILLDLKMPGMNGWETMAALREHPATAQIPIVILSNLAPGDGAGKDLIRRWVQKPFDEETLLGTLAHSLGSSSSPLRILIVEDDADLRAVLMTMFQRPGIQVSAAATGREAIALGFSLNPDLVILDVVLPHGDGFDVVQRFREHESLRRTPLMIYSAVDLSAEDRKKLELGPTDFFEKSRITPELFREEVLRLLRTVVETIRNESDEAKMHTSRG